ncbi:MAG: DUF4920 domain-containing protein [Myxococcota bacterium]|nr:DUF4920 domain-containing protein [Myxococcota bacterium]
MKQFITLIALAVVTLIGCKAAYQNEPVQDENKAAQKVEPASTAPTEKPGTAATLKTNEPSPQTDLSATATNESDKAIAEPTTCAGSETAAKGGCGGCAGSDKQLVAAAPEQAAEAKQHFGGDFTLTEPAIKVDSVMATPADFAGKNIKVTARIAKVCKKKGCWMTLQPEDAGDEYVRVTMKDYGFFVPVDCDGKTATVEGLLKSVERPEALRKHLAEDGGDDPSKIKGAAVELSMVATAIDIEQ